MRILTVAAAAAISFPLLTSDAMAFFLCDHHPAAESSGRFSDNENSINWWKGYGTDIGGDLDQGTNVYAGGADLGFNLDRLFPNGIGQLTGNFAHADSEDWRFRNGLLSASIGQNDNFGSGGGWAVTYGETDYDFSGFFGTQDVDGQFFQAQAHCVIGNQNRITGQIGTMRLEDDFNEVDVTYGALKIDHWFDDYTAAHGVVSYAENDSDFQTEATQFSVGVRWQFDPTKPFTVGAEFSYMDVEDPFQSRDLSTIMVTVSFMSLGREGEVPTLREFDFHSSHVWGSPPASAFQVR